MDEFIRKVKLIGIDKKEIKKADIAGYYYYLPFRLSETPHHQWQLAFREVFGGKKHGDKKRPTSVSGDRIIVGIKTSDDIQHQVDIIKNAVDATNRKIDKINKNILKNKEKEKKQKAKEIDVIKKFQEKADKIKF